MDISPAVGGRVPVMPPSRSSPSFGDDSEPWMDDAAIDLFFGPEN
jgi:hypothetical protein